MSLPIRWKAVIPLTGLFAIGAILTILFLDPVAQWAIKKGGEAVLGARVDIGSVSVKIGKSALVIDGLQAADKSEPMKNLFEFKQATFDFETLPLFEKKVIIDQASLAGLRFGTPRKTSGALPFVEKKPGFVGKAADKLWSQVEAFSLSRLDDAKKFTDPKTLVNPQALESVKAAEAAKQKAEQAPAQLQADLKALRADERSQALRQRVESLGKGGQGVDGALRTVEEVKAIQAELNQFRSDVDAARHQVQTRVQDLKSSVDTVRQAREKDWSNLRSLVSLPSFDQGSIARTVFGPNVVGQVERLLGYVHTARRYMPAKSTPPPPPPRGQGRVVEFPRHNVLPRFLLKKALLSGEAGQEKPLAFEGTLEGVTSNPPLYGKPMIAAISGAQGPRALAARVALDYTKDAPKESLNAKYSGFALGTQSFGPPESFGLSVSQGTGAAEGAVDIAGDVLNGRLRFAGQNLKIQPSLGAVGSSAIAQRLAQSMTSSLAKESALSVGVVLGGTLASPTFSIESNIGGLLSGAMKNALGSEMAQQEKALRAELEKHTSAALGQLEGQISSLQNQYLSQLTSQNKLIDDLLSQVKKKAAGSIPLPGGDAPLKNLKNIFGR